MNSGSELRPFAETGERVLFGAVDPYLGNRTLWVTDGTEVGTVMLAAVEPPYDPRSAATIEGVVYFPGNEGSTQVLWRTDGTPGGTNAITPIEFRGPEMVALDGKVFFCGRDSTHGWELWVSDGTPGGTHLVVDLVPGISGSYPVNGARHRFAELALGGRPTPGRRWRIAQMGARSIRARSDDSDGFREKGAWHAITLLLTVQPPNRPLSRHRPRLIGATLRINVLLRCVPPKAVSLGWQISRF